MTARRELLQASAYERRRQVAALLGGGLGLDGDGTDRTSPGRSAACGLALALLLVLGFAAKTLLAPGLPTGWDRPGLVIVPETGERFLITEEDGPLRPVADLASAQLVLGADVRPTLVPAATIAGHPRGPALGLVGGPQRLPTGDALIQSGWSACTADGAGLALAVTRTPEVVGSPGDGMVATAGGATWLVAPDAAGHARRYRVPARDGDAVLAAVGLPPVAQSVRVPESWLALFPVGGVLTGETWVRAHWAATTLRPLASPACAELVAARDGASYVRLGTLPAGTGWTPPEPGEVVRTVDPGGGALVASGGRRLIVDDRGAADPIDDQALAALGFGERSALRLPTGWQRLLAGGVPLTTEATE